MILAIALIVVIAVLGGMVWFLYVHFMGPSLDALARRAQQGPKAPARNLRFEVDLKDLYLGASTKVHLERQVLCKACVGTGIDIHAGYHTCHDCDGTGVQTFVQQIGSMKQYVRSRCSTCHGNGRVPAKQCPVCQGRGVRKEKATLDVKIDEGMHHGDKITLAGEGDQIPKALPGDIVVHLMLRHHTMFRRRQDDLEVDLNISLVEALTGFERALPHLDGRNVSIKRSDVVQPDSIWRIPSEGMPIRGSSRKGDLLVISRVEFPTRITAEDAAAVEKLLQDTN